MSGLSWEWSNWASYFLTLGTLSQKRKTHVSLIINTLITVCSKCQSHFLSKLLFPTVFPSHTEKLRQLTSGISVTLSASIFKVLFVFLLTCPPMTPWNTDHVSFMHCACMKMNLTSNEIKEKFLHIQILSRCVYILEAFIMAQSVCLNENLFYLYTTSFNMHFLLFFLLQFLF